MIASTALSAELSPTMNASRAFKRVLFLICPTGTFCREDRCQSYFAPQLIPSMRPPLEECEAAGALRELGVTHLVVDGPAERLDRIALQQKITSFNPDLIVVAVTFGSLKDDLDWIRIIKPLCAASIGLRGAPCYVRSKPILEENPEVDFCLHGEYELIFEHLAQYGLEKAPGTSVRDGSGRVISYAPPPLRPLDELPLPDRSTINSLLYTVRGSRKPQATIRVQRGCPFPCTYCLVSVVSGNKARHRSPESIANEMKMLMDQGISHFYLRADTFSLDKKWAMEVARSIARECPGARWVTTTRVECVDAPLLQAMRNAGCYGISFGLDVASEEIGVLVKKPPRLKEAEHALRTCDRFGIISLVYFMIGFIWESEQSLRETSRFIKQIRPDLITIHFAYPYPGTSYYEAARSAGFISDKTRAQAEPAIELPGFSTERLQKFSKRILLTHYLRPSVIYSIVRKMVRTIQVFSL